MFWSLDFLFKNGNSKTKNDWIFDFRFQIEKPKLKYKAFFFITVKKGFTKLNKRDDFHFLLLKTKNKITRKQKQKKPRFFIFCYRKLPYKIRAQTKLTEVISKQKHS